MKKILHIIAQRPGRTGSGIYLQSIINEAYNKNHQQAVVFASPKKEFQKSDFQLEKIKPTNLYPVVFESEEINFPVVGMSDVMPYLNTRYSELSEEMFSLWKKSFVNAIDKAVSEFKPDIIISQHIWILTSIVKERYPDIPIIAASHGTGIRQLELCKHSENNFAEYILHKVNQFELILALNQFQKQLIIEKYQIKRENRNKIKVLGSGYNSSIFYKIRDFEKNNNLNSDRVNLIAVGKISFSKGLFSLLKSIEILIENKKIQKNILLRLVGSGKTEESEKIKEFAKELEERFKPLLEISFVGAVSQKELNIQFNKSDIFILPSFYEGLPLVIIEAMAAGLRIISSDLPGLSEWLGNDILSLKENICLVGMPKMESIDVPDKNSLKDFEHELSNSIYEMAKNSTNIDPLVKAKVSLFLKGKSWTGLFSKIEIEINRLCENEMDYR